MQFIKETHIDFIGKRKIALTVSGILILIGIVSLIINGGPNYGIDFVGGTLIQVKFSQDVPVGKIRTGLATIGFNDASVQHFGHAEDFEFLISLRL